MGTRFRKSKNFGPFRINFSKSGVGYSYGNKYARVTHTADGKKRTTYTIPGTGISWQETEKRQPERRPAQRMEYTVAPEEAAAGQHQHEGLKGFLLFAGMLAAVILVCLIFYGEL